MTEFAIIAPILLLILMGIMQLGVVYNNWVTLTDADFADGFALKYFAHVRLLRAAPDSAFWAGMITNIELPATVPERMRTFEPSAELEDSSSRSLTWQMASSREASAVRQKARKAGCCSVKVASWSPPAGSPR